MAGDKAIATLMDRHGRTFCDELGIDIAKNTPSPLFRWLTACVLFSAPIQHDLAVSGAKALSKAGWRTAQKMSAATWEDRVAVLNENGYARYDERTARILQDASDHIVEEYGGDLRKLREASDGDPADIRRRLKAVKGMGDVAVDIFFREAQAAWDELYPFADDLALKAAARLKLPKTAKGLANRVPKERFVTLVAALTRDELGQ